MKTLLRVKVSPGAANSEIMGWSEQTLRIRVQAPPEKGKANKELRRFLAKTLGIAVGRVTLRSGDASRHKSLVIDGMDSVEIYRKLQKQK